MGKGLRSSACKSASHRLFKDRAKNRVGDLQEMFSDLQSARKESRTVDVGVLEEQVHQMLREWKAELNEPSQASSLQQGGSLGSSEICKMLQFCEEDDATSELAAPKPDPDAQKVVDGLTAKEGGNPQELHFPSVDQCISVGTEVNNMEMLTMNWSSQGEYNSFDFHQQLDQQDYSEIDEKRFSREDELPQISGCQHNFCPPPSAFLGPKCALWDCPRPAMQLDWCRQSHDYCSIYHTGLARSEGYIGKPPILRPGGIGLKDNLILSALRAKTEGKDVGIPECEGAATAKSPWNAPELFDLSVLDGETIREWLFFDKPRRAFESGNRKQRSLPDFNGRGWHESRKQVMKELGGLKKSYYMDPQPMEKFEWHLFEYEINEYDTLALYRLELKRKTPKGKPCKDSVAHLQKQMGMLSAEVPQLEGRVKANSKGGNGSVYSGSSALAS